MLRDLAAAPLPSTGPWCRVSGEIATAVVSARHDRRRRSRLAIRTSCPRERPPLAGFLRKSGSGDARRLLGHANISTTQRNLQLDDRELADAQDLVE